MAFLAFSNLIRKHQEQYIISKKNSLIKPMQNDPGQKMSHEQITQASHEIILQILSEITAKPTSSSGKPMTSLFTHIYNPNYNIHQGKCYQQFSPNLCGYHAIFNTFCFLKMFSGDPCDYNIESGASFWKFKIKIEKFLFWVKRKYGLPEEWPWREKDIREGDFERTYNKICIERFDEFSLFSCQQKFFFMTHTWQFQYQNLILEHDSKNELNQKINRFRKYNGTKPMVLHLMLGITTHWLTFLAVKKGEQVEYWFFDSHNQQHLDYSWAQIVAFIEFRSKDRTKYGKPEFTKFQKQSYSMCIKDIQTSLRLIIDCLQGRQTLDSYMYNQKFALFADPLQAAMAADYESVSIVVREYQHNIRSFFVERIQWNLLTQTNHSTMKQILTLSSQMKSYNQEGNFLYSVTKKQISFWSL